MERAAQTRLIAICLAVVPTILAGLAIGTAALATVSDGVDNLYPTNNATWVCQGSSNASTLFCMTDNSTLTFGVGSSLTSTQKNVVRNMIMVQYDPTNLTVSEQTAISYTGTAETDIVYQVGTLPSGTNGITWCDDAVTSVRCDQHYVVMVSSRVTTTASTPCHETGHAVGLTHGAQAFPSVANDDSDLECLMTPGTSVTTLGSHNAFRINLDY